MGPIFELFQKLMQLSGFSSEMTSWYQLLAFYHDLQGNYRVLTPF
jgi:hypothetical protein